MNIFISHATDETLLAQGWRDLFEDIAPSVNVWFSSDVVPGGGIGPGRWREKISEKLKKADVVLGIFTPESVNRPWLFFETAFAMGLDDKKVVIPLVYYMGNEALPSPLQDLQAYRGDQGEATSELIKRVIKLHTGKDPKGKRWGEAVDDYIEHVALHTTARKQKSLFHGQFHTLDTAKKLEGDWFAKWTQFDDDGKESPFEAHPMKIWTTDDRLRLVGKAKKGAEFYPMEGVVSSTGGIALSYWSEKDIPICGTALLKLFAANRMMRGTWEGFTDESLEYEELSLVRGRVVIGRDEEKVEKYWGIKP